MDPKAFRRFATPLLIAFAAGGWVWAFTLKAGNAHARTDAGNDGAGGRASLRAGERHAGKAPLASLLPTDRSARLLARIDGIVASARPGETNERLISACKETLLDSDHNRRQRDFALLIDLLRPEDAAAMHEAFLALHREGRGFGHEYSAFATRWGEVDPVGALDYLAAERPLRMPTPDFANIVRGWAQTDPQAALAWMKEHPDLAASKEGWSAVINGWMRNDPKAATDYLLGADLPPNQLYQSVSYAAVEMQFSGGVEQAVDWIASLPDDGLLGGAAGAAWRATAFNHSELPYDTAADVWSRVGGEPWMRFEQFEHFSGMVSGARVNDRGVEGFLETLHTRWPEDRIAGTFANWAKAQPDHVSRWLANAPDGAFKDAAIRGASEAGLTPPE